MRIVDHQPDPVFQPRQVLQQPLHDRPSHPDRAPPSAAAPARPPLRRSASATKIQSRCGSRSPPGTATHEDYLRLPFIPNRYARNELMKRHESLTTGDGDNFHSLILCMSGKIWP